MPSTCPRPSWSTAEALGAAAALLLPASALASGSEALGTAASAVSVSAGALSILRRDDGAWALATAVEKVGLEQIALRRHGTRATEAAVASTSRILVGPVSVCVSLRALRFVLAGRATARLSTAREARR